MKDKAYLEFAVEKYEKRKKELLIEKESGEYKRNALKSGPNNVEKAKNLLTHLTQSSQNEPSSCKGAYGRNPEQGKTKKVSQVAWQVLKITLLFHILGRIEVGERSQ